jgi:hypothetical protein
VSREVDLTRAKRLVLALPFLLCACGKSSNPVVSNPTPTPTTPPSSCQQETLASGKAPIDPQAVLYTAFTLKAAGRVDVTIDWTRALATMRLAIVTGPCDDFKTGNCTKLLDVKSPPKPAKGSVALSPDTYNVVLESQSNFKDEVSYTIVRSDAGCPLP